MTGVTTKLDNIESKISLQLRELRCNVEEKLGALEEKIRTMCHSEEKHEYSEIAENKGIIISHFRLEQRTGSIRLFWMDKNKQNAEIDS
jgi:hypothetical protein